MAWLKRSRGWPRRGLGWAAVLVACWLASGVALAQKGTASSTAVVSPGVDRILLALGILLLLAQATERLMVVFRKVLAWRGVRWAQARSWERIRSREEEAEETAVFAVSSILAGLLVAFFCGVDILEVVRTGDVALVWQPGMKWMAALRAHWPGMVVAGVIASMGPAFIGDLIELVKAVRQVKEYEAEEKRLRALRAAEGGTGGDAPGAGQPAAEAGEER